MVHADASKFASGASKAEVYDKILEEARTLFDNQRNWVSTSLCSPVENSVVASTNPSNCSLQVCNLSNASSLLWHAYHSLPSPSSAVNWAGFYVVDPKPSSKPQLILGPFHGRPACQSIALGRGLCGTAAGEKRVVRVEDVSDFPGHIACDAESKSEIVVPVVKGDELFAIIDVDCAEFGSFDEVDEHGLVRLAELIAQSCDWPVSHYYGG